MLEPPLVRANLAISRIFCYVSLSLKRDEFEELEWSSIFIQIETILSLVASYFVVGLNQTSQILNLFKSLKALESLIR